ncbi:MAG: DUF2868 domain-containing protein, partial [Thiohalocapsa sp.]
RSKALRRWLTARRRIEDPALRPLLPGAAYARGQRLVSIGLMVLGFVLGIGVASALLSYDGKHPVNVSWYIFVLVLMQILLVAATLGLWYSRRTAAMKTAVQDVSLLGQIIKPLFARAARWVQRQRLAHVPPDVRDRAKAKQGLLESHYGLYGPATYLPILIPAQLFGIGFNVGVIVITVALEWFTDLAFGWGSALNVGPGTIHGIAQGIALPWSWLFGEGVGVPTLEQVAGTRINLKDPLFMLNAEHLRSWRWFLVLSVFTYGLVPRLVMLGLSVLKQRRTLAALPFTHQRTQALYARLITPVLETGGSTGTGPEMPIPAPLRPLTTSRAAPQPSVQTAPVAEPTTPPAPDSAPQKPPEQAPSAVEEQIAERPARVPVEPKSPAQLPSQQSGDSQMPAAKGKPRTQPEPATSKVSPPKPALPTQDRPKPRPQGSVQAEPKRKSGRSVRQTETIPPKPTAPPKPKAEPKTENRRERAQSPAVETKPKPKPKPEPATQPKAPAPPASAQAAKDKKIAADACVLLIHVDVADILEDADHGRLQQMLRQLSGWQVANSATFGGGSKMADQALALVQDGQWQAPPARVALLQDGSQPPITENLRFLRSVRAAAGDQAQILLALVGDPEGDDPLPPLAAFDFTDWQRKIEQMGDPYLRLEMLAGPAEETH